MGTHIREAPAVDELPRIISVDDHVLEPATVWQDRLPGTLKKQGPRIVRERGTLLPDRDGMLRKWSPCTDGAWADVWHYEDVAMPLVRPMAAVGTEIKSMGQDVITLDDVRPGCVNQAERLADMDRDHTEASLCFPNTLPRFCGQTFAERSDKELALLCVQAYNDWTIDEWCTGDGYGRLIPLTLVPLWYPQLAAEEVQRCAAKGAHAITFSENPYALGLPSIYSGTWEVMFAACEETETTISMHIGSSSRVMKTSPDAPSAAGSVLIAQNAAGSLVDFVLSGTLHRFPNLTLAYSEANAGWLPYVVHRMDRLWMDRNNANADIGGIDLPLKPSDYVRGRVFGCILDDEVGISMRDRVGDNQICFETDYPHGDCKWPYSLEAARRLIEVGNLTEQEVHKFLRGNAIKAYGLSRFGIVA